MCDVCIKMRNNRNQKGRRGEIAESIKQLLQQYGEMKISQLETIAADEYSYYLNVLREMRDNNLVVITGDLIKLP